MKKEPKTCGPGNLFWRFRIQSAKELQLVNSFSDAIGEVFNLKGKNQKAGGENFSFGNHYKDEQ
jgi:hypothetical protein